MSKKTIFFNPDLLSTNKNKTIKKKIKPTSSSLVRPNKLRSELINKIKNFQKRENQKQKEEKKKENNKNTNLETFTSDFNDSINFLENLSKKKTQIEPSQEISVETSQPALHTPVTQPIIDAQPPQPISHVLTETETHVSTEPSIHVSDQPNNSNFRILNREAPPYSTLKNGSKPTYREWKKNMNSKLNNTTLKKNIKQEITIHDKDIPYINTERSNKLEELKKIYKKKSSLPKKYIKKQIKTIKYKLGKKEKINKVSVLIKNNETRKKIKKECGILKQTSIKEIKDYLRSQNLLKVGSIAPNDVLRKMYEQSILTGEVTNKNGNTLIHNFFN